ncbi:hypothetical protein BJX76DRAFT_332162 [Aspergillus varians]
MIGFLHPSSTLTLTSLLDSSSPLSGSTSVSVADSLRGGHPPLTKVLRDFASAIDSLKMANEYQGTPGTSQKSPC